MLKLLHAIPLPDIIANYKTKNKLIYLNKKL